MAARVSPTERIGAQIDELFASEGDLGEVLEQVARLGACLLLQSALEAEVSEHLGRDRYERRKNAAGAKDGSRKGYSQLTIKTTTGPVTLSRPKLRGTSQAFAVASRRANTHAALLDARSRARKAVGKRRGEAAERQHEDRAPSR